jgi:Acetyltransferase (GNAT) domain
MNIISAQRPKPVPAERDSASVESLVYRDLPLGELPQEMRARLRTFPFLSWLGSLGFCESYAYPSNQRHACLSDHSGEIQETLFYNERKWAGIFRELEIVGPVAPSSQLFPRLSCARQPDLLTLSWQLTSEFPKRTDNLTLLDVRRTAEDYRIDLPETPEAYLQGLGKQTRKHLPYYWRRLQREWAGRFAIEAASGSLISRESYSDLLKLNQLRMRTKRRQSLWKHEVADRRWRIVQQSGLLVSLKLGEQLSCGTLSFLQGREAYLIVIAHDPRYDRLNLGNVCLWRTIEHLIRLGYTAFHLLWGASFYKAQFGGQIQPIYRVTYASNPRAATAWRLWRLLRIGEAVSMTQKMRRRVADYGVLMLDSVLPQKPHRWMRSSPDQAKTHL